MASYRESLSKPLSLLQFHELTGITDTVIKKRLVAAGLEPIDTDNRSMRFNPREALPILYNAKPSVNAPSEGRRRAEMARAELLEAKMKAETGRLVPADDQDRVVIALATMTRDRLLDLRSSLAPALAAATTPDEVDQILGEAIENALADLVAEKESASRRLKEVA